MTDFKEGKLSNTAGLNCLVSNIRHNKVEILKWDHLAFSIRIDGDEPCYVITLKELIQMPLAQMNNDTIKKYKNSLGEIIKVIKKEIEIADEKMIEGEI